MNPKGPLVNLHCCSGGSFQKSFAPKVSINMEKINIFWKNCMTDYRPPLELCFHGSVEVTPSTKPNCHCLLGALRRSEGRGQGQQPASRHAKRRAQLAVFRRL